MKLFHILIILSVSITCLLLDIKGHTMPDTNKVKELLRLNDYDICKVWEFYDKSESDVKRDISIIREWLKQQPHLPDDEGMIRKDILSTFIIDH